MLTKIVMTTAVIFAMSAAAPAGCESHSPKIQNTNVQDVSQFPACDDDQGRGPVHPCTTKDGSKWIVWVVGIADCPAKTKQSKDEVKCLNAAG
jgi:hypothetical protein